MDIKHIASLVYIFILVIHAAVMAYNNVKTGSTVYITSLICIIVAYICGQAKGGVFD